MINKTERIEVDSGEKFLDLIKALSQKGNIYIVGAGNYGKIIGKFLIESDVRLKGYVDKNPKLCQVNDLKVYMYSEVFPENDYFIVSSFAHTDSILNELKKINIPEEYVVLFPHIQNIVYDIYEFLVNYSRYTEKIQRFHNQYFGKRCFIIGNGPSLKISDLERLGSEVTFASNCVYALYGSTFWRPTFYCAFDVSFCKSVMALKEDMQKLTSNCKAVFTHVMSEGFRYCNDKEIDNIFYLVRKTAINTETGLPMFSDDCCKQVYDSRTVTYVMLQLALYMGFKEIYLLGVDCSYSIERHVDGSITKNNVMNYQKIIQQEDNDKNFEAILLKELGAFADIDAQISGYKAAKKYADSHSVKIYNATRGGKLEVFDRISFDKIMFVD